MQKKAIAVLGSSALIIAAIIGGVIGKQVGKAAVSPQSPTEPDEILFAGFTKAAEQANARGPIMVDDETRWDKSVAGPGPRLTYFYTFPKYSSTQIGREFLLTNFEPELKKKVCGSKEMKLSLDYGGTYIYAYAGNDGVEIARFELNKDDCGL